MRSDKYLFDKRQRKRNFIKYLIIFAIGFVPVVLFNIYLGSALSRGWVITLDCFILFIFAIIGNIIASKVYEKIDENLEKKREARDKVNAQKREILEASYKAKKLKKQQAKESKDKQEK